MRQDNDIANEVKRWPGPEMEDNIPILMAELGYKTPKQTQALEVVIHLGDCTHKRFIPVEGKFISFCWLEDCINSGLTTLQQLLDDGVAFFGRKIWDDKDHIGLVSFLQSAEAVVVTLDRKTYVLK